MDVEFLLDPTDEIPVAVCAREPLTPALWDEAWPLIERHYRALGAWSGAPLEPDVERYAAMQSADILRVYTARWHGKLVGYVAYMVHRGLHYSTLMFASEDTLWVDPEVRASTIGRDLLTHAEECLREDGVDMILQHSRYGQCIGSFLKRLGYTPVDTVFCKRITHGHL